MTVRWIALIALVVHIAVDGEEFVVTKPPVEMKLPAFYGKYVSAGGYPIVSSPNVSDYALQEAAYIVSRLLAHRPDLKKVLIDGGSRLTVMAHNEFTTDVPEHSHLRPKDEWDIRARGLGGSDTDPVCSCGEENLLAFEGDTYPAENILIHEFAHTIHLRGMNKLDPTFDSRLKAAYQSAMKKEMWKKTYAATNHEEYFAEGVQCWFDNNRENDSVHNYVNTRAELKEYDPGLAALCEETFGSTVFVYTKPTTRLRDHLKGYQPEKAPKFQWPEHLKRLKNSAESKR